MPLNSYWSNAVSGGSSGSLDSIDGDLLNEGDINLVVVPGDKTYFYTLDSTIGGSESIPGKITPDTNPGTKRWILIGIYAGTIDHSVMDNLDYASAGHTGFLSDANFTIYSGTLQDQITNNAADISTNTSNIATNVTNIGINTSDIANISGTGDANALAIAANTTLIETTSGTLQDNIDNLDYYTQAEVDGKWTTWSGTIDHDTINNYEVEQHRVINDSGSTATELWSAEQIEDRIVTATGTLTSAHSSLTELDYASAGHTGFASTAALTTTSGDLQTQVTDNTNNIATNTIDIANVSGTTDANTLAITANTTLIGTTSGTLQTDIDTNTANISTNTYDIGVVSGTVDSHIASTANPHTVTLEQARAADSTISGNIDFNENSIDNLDALNFALTSGTAQIYWDEEDFCAYVDNGLGHPLHVGRDSQIEYLNTTGSLIPTGTVLSVTGAAAHPVSGNILLTVLLPRADISDTLGRNIMIATHDVEDDASGVATHVGKLYHMDTSTFTIGDVLYISATTAGALTNIRPEFPNYEVFVGTAMEIHATLGKINIDPNLNVDDTDTNFFNGLFRESFDFLVTSSGSTVTGTLTPNGTNVDMTLMFSSGFSIFDTSPGAEVLLTAGTDEIPQTNYIYIPETTKVLTVSTSAWLEAEHVKIAQISLRSAAATASDGVMRNQNWNDHLAGTNHQGHLSHVTEKLRQFEAQWDNGVEGSSTTDGTDVWVSNTAGEVYQMHKQTFPAYDTETGDDLHIVNNFAESYVTETNLNTQILDSLGNSLSNLSFSFVMWGISNKTGEPSHLMINLPTGGYSKNFPDTAVNDASNTSVYTIPRDYQGVGFLIARFTYILAGTTSWTLYDTEDLRGRVPNASAGGGGGGGGVTSFLGLTDTPSAYTGEGGKSLKVNIGDTAVEFLDLVETDITDLDKYTQAEVDTISGSLQSEIDGKDNYASWSFAVDGVTKDAITSGDIFNIVGGDNITVTRSAEDAVTIAGESGAIAGQEAIADTATTTTVTFASTEADTDYFITATLQNTTDSPPSIYTYIVTETTVDDFTVVYGGVIDSANYLLNWSLSR